MATIQFPVITVRSQSMAVESTFFDKTIKLCIFLTFDSFIKKISKQLIKT